MAPKKDYTPEQMGKAIEAVGRGLNVSAAAKKYGVPRITLRNKVTGKSPIDCKMGPATVLTTGEEKLLTEWIFQLSDRHFPIGKEQLLDSVQKIVTDQKRENPFTDNRPGKKWYQSFMNRHPEIAVRTAQNLTSQRHAVTEDNIKGWFTEVNQYLTRDDLVEAMRDPRRIYNADEAAFFLQPEAGRVLTRRGERNVYSFSGDEKENLTVLVTANAAGEMAPSMIVFDYERIPSYISQDIPEDWGIGRSDNGWMCGRTFYEYMTNIFNPWIIRNNVPKPVVFFLDGHSSHLTIHLSNFCAENGIEVIALYPNSTHLIQPMDIAVFRPLKGAWKLAVRAWKTEHLGEIFKKEHFAPSFQRALNSISETSIKNGFRASGLYPFGWEFFDFTKLNKKSNDTNTNERNINKEKTTNFLNCLEAEIVKNFFQEKLSLFKDLYYKDRSVMEISLPDEDQSLYVIWAKTKNASSQTGLDSQDSGRQESERPIPNLNENNVRQNYAEGGLGNQGNVETTLLCHDAGSQEVEIQLPDFTENNNIRHDNGDDECLVNQDNVENDLLSHDAGSQEVEIQLPDFTENINIRHDIGDNYDLLNPDGVETDLVSQDTGKQESKRQLSNWPQKSNERENNDTHSLINQDNIEHYCREQGIEKTIPDITETKTLKNNAENVLTLMKENTTDQNEETKISLEAPVFPIIEPHNINIDDSTKTVLAKSRVHVISNNLLPSTNYKRHTDSQSAAELSWVTRNLNSAELVSNISPELNAIKTNVSSGPKCNPMNNLRSINVSEKLPMKVSATSYNNSRLNTQTTPSKNLAPTSVSTSDSLSLPPPKPTSKNMPADVVLAPVPTCSTSQFTIPSPFKRALFWPDESVSKKKKRITKEKLPSAITSHAWREYNIKKENDKKQCAEAKKQRMQAREEKRKIKQDLLKRKEEEKIRKAKTKKKNTRDFESTSSSQSEVELGDQSSDSGNSDNILSYDDSLSTVSESDTNENDTRNIQISKCDWVIVNFLSNKKKIYKYVGNVKEVTKQGIVVKFAKKITDKKFKWPEKDDVVEVARHQIVKRIGAPVFKGSNKRVGNFVFKKSLKNFKIDV